MGQSTILFKTKDVQKHEAKRLKRIFGQCQIVLQLISFLKIFRLQQVMGVGGYFSCTRSKEVEIWALI